MTSVSVIIPCYNQGRFLSDAIDSALAQPGVEVEVVVVNDGSTDETRSVCGRYGSRIIAVHQANAGLAMARNVGILASRGQFLQFLDADDRILPTKFAEQTAALQATPEAGAAYSQGYLIREDGSRNGEAQVNHPAGWVFHSLLKMWGTLVPAVLVRRSALAKVGLFDLDPAIRGCEDLDMWLRLARHFQFVSLPNFHFEYRASAGQMSSKLEMMLASGLHVQRKHAGAHGNCPECRHAVREGRRRWKTVTSFGLMTQARHEAAQGNWRETLRKVARVIQLDPAHLAKMASPAHLLGKAALVLRSLKSRNLVAASTQST